MQHTHRKSTEFDYVSTMDKVIRTREIERFFDEIHPNAPEAARKKMTEIILQFLKYQDQ
jgi:hypothetical protein